MIKGRVVSLPWFARFIFKKIRKENLTFSRFLSLRYPEFWRGELGRRWFAMESTVPSVAREERRREGEAGRIGLSKPRSGFDRSKERTAGDIGVKRALGFLARVDS